MSVARPDVSVVIPTRGRPASLRRAVTSLGHQTLSPARFEVVVAIDGPDEETRRMADTLATPVALRVLEGPRRGRAGACNAAIRAANGRVLVILDDDMEPAPDCLAAHLAAHPSGSRRCLVAAAPVAITDDAPALTRAMGEKFNRHLERLARAGHRFALRDFYSGHCSIPREVLVEVGLYDEDFTAYGNEDLELSVRLREAGVEIAFAPQAVAVQRWDKGFPGLARDTESKGRTAVLLARKHPHTLPELQLASARSASWRWRVVRGPLLAASRGTRIVPSAVIAATRLRERVGGRGLPVCYHLALDYFYWLGATSALREGGRPVTSANGGAPARVLCFTDSTLFGGAEQALLTLLTGLDRARFRPVLVHHAAPDLAPLIDAADAHGVARWVVPPMPEGLAGAWTAMRFAARLRARRPDVFHAHMSWPLGCKWALAAAAAARVPAVVGTVQLFVEIPMGAARRIQATALGRLVGRFLAVSEDTRMRLSHTFGWPPERLRVVRNAIPLERFTGPADPAVRRSLDDGSGRALALVPARLDGQKGHEHLLAAAARRSDVRFLCAGDGPLRAAIARRADELGVADRVELLGFRDDVPALLGACDLVVLPSLYEGLPLSLIEAMAAGRPVVATDVGGTPELVVHEESGLLVPPGDPEALAAAIGRVISEPGLAERLGDAGRERVLREFSSPAMVDAITAEYDRLLAGRGARGGR